MKSEEAPIISVVIACYNQGIYLSDALNSLEKQTFQNWEGIIVNDGSTDGTEEIADADTSIPFLGNDTFNDIITNIETGTRYLFYYKYTVEDTTYTGNFVFVTENGEIRKISFSNSESSISLFVEETGVSGGPIEIAVTLP